MTKPRFIQLTQRNSTERTKILINLNEVEMFRQMSNETYLSEVVFFKEIIQVEETINEIMAAIRDNKIQ